MTATADTALRDAVAGDLPAIARLRESVGWGVHEWALRAVIEQPDARCVVVTDAQGEVVAVGSGIIYGPLGFVGNMIVGTAHRRRGLGSAVLLAVADFLEGAGCRRLELNATNDGRPLYERHGFRTTGTSATARLLREHLARPTSRVPAHPARPADLDALAEYDRPRFGGDRRRLLSLLLADPACRCLLAGTEGGEIAGYACIRTDQPRIGPFVADGTEVAEGLLMAAFAALPDAGELRLNLPPDNAPGAAWLRSLGVTIEPWDGRMARGEPLPRRGETLFGMTVGALG